MPLLQPKAVNAMAAEQSFGWFVWAGLLSLLISLAVVQQPDSDVSQILFVVGAIGLWRYSVGACHFLRGWWFQRIVYPRHRLQARRAIYTPDRVYYVVTSYRIPRDVTLRVFESVFAEAQASGYPSTVIASVVEQDEAQVISALYAASDSGRVVAGGQRVELLICEDRGTGKRDAIADALLRISNDRSPDSIVFLVDGDTVLEPGAVARSVPYFGVFPHVGGLTTNERCEVRANRWFKAWYELRFAQRHMNMSSMALCQGVLTLTGRMSAIRASIACDPAFIASVRSDSIEHWRLGRFRFLTGDDKSTWMAVVGEGWRTYYVPDAVVTTVEDPPNHNFLAASRTLMFRWYGNSLRQNLRATKLGPARLGRIPYFVLLDQRLSIWTTLVGPAALIVSLVTGAFSFVLIYLAWIALSRTCLSLLLTVSGHTVNPLFPVLMYFNQVVGSLVKVRVLFNLDRQSWTRQALSLNRGLTQFQERINRWTSFICMCGAVSFFFGFISLIAINT